MAAIRAYTTIEQSCKLAEILPLESADMYYAHYHNPISGASYYEEYPIFHIPMNKSKSLPCWSLAALISVLPVIIGDVLSENSLRLRMDKSETDFNIWYEIIDTGMVEEGFDIIKTNPVDACVDMITKLHELNLL